MARARRKRGRLWPLALGLLAAAAGTAWWLVPRAPPMRPDAVTPPPAAPGVVAADRVDAANEGRRIALEGTLHVVEPARDAQLGVSADALVLLRKVEMRQWRETCAAGGCDYALTWSEQAIDSHAFKAEKGHENPARLPFSSGRFASGDVRLGAFRVDAAFAAAAAAAPVPYPVHAAQLPPNLAATFRERDGLLYAGNDPANMVAGDLRVSYWIIAAGPVHLRGIQTGDRLKPSPVP